MHTDFIVLSNVFFLFPVVASMFKKEWIYFVISSSACVASPLYHYMRIHERMSPVFPIVRTSDWVVALCAYGYMYYFIFKKARPKCRIHLAIFLTGTLAFFFYGFLLGDYDALHPWFHIAIGVVSGFIVSSRTPLQLQTQR